MKRIAEGVNVFNEFIAPDVCDMRVYAPDCFNDNLPSPGQFYMLYLNKGEHLLPRPFSICDADGAEKTLRFIIRVTGAGTACLAGLAEGERISINGPLGNGFLSFSENDGGFTHVLLGGGVGAAPLLMLARAVSGQKKRVITVLGFRDRPYLLREFAAYCEELHIATDSGSYGFAGGAVELLKRLDIQNAYIYSCGPRPMLKALADYAAPRGIPALVSLEERMACGIGACVCCAAPVRTENGQIYKKVCADGPVFDIRDVIL